MKKVVESSALSKRKRKLNAAEKRARKKRRQEFMTIFINGKQKRVKRPPTIDGMDVDEFITRNADPIWLHQNGMWEDMTPGDAPEDIKKNLHRTALAIG